MEYTDKSNRVICTACGEMALMKIKTIAGSDTVEFECTNKTCSNENVVFMDSVATWHTRRFAMLDLH